MLRYSNNEHLQYQSVKEKSSNKIKKPRKCSLRATRKHLKREFEKLLVPDFAYKFPRNRSEKPHSKDSTNQQAKKCSKVLPDNLAEFIVENEAVHEELSEDEYLKCMEILTTTANRKNQIMQICQLLGEI